MRALGKLRSTKPNKLLHAARGTLVPLSFSPGEAFQFDWSEDWAVIDGESTKLQVVHLKLSHSRAFLLRSCPLQAHEMLFDAHNRAFAVFGGMPRRAIYDNMKTAVNKVGRGKAREINTRFCALVSHYLFKANFCNPATGWEKGGKSRITCATHAIGCGSTRRHSPRCVHSTTGCSCSAEHFGARSDT